MTTSIVTDESFEADVLRSSRPVLVDFWAEWCGPCRQVAPVLEEISAEMADSVTIAKMNIDESPATPTRYGVRGIPALLLFKDGKVAGSMQGAHRKSRIVEWLNEHVGAAPAAGVN